MKQENIMMILPIFGIIFVVITYFIFGLKQTSSTIFMVSIYSLFLGSFFFTFGAWIEELLVKDQIEHLTKEFVDVYHIFVGDKSISKLADDTSEDDKKVEDANKKLIGKAMLILCSGCLFGLVISYVLCVVGEGGMKDGLREFSGIAIDNFIVLIFVAITQAIFFYTVSRTYKSLDSNKVIEKILSIKREDAKC